MPTYTPASQGGVGAGAPNGQPLPGSAPNQSLVNNNVQNDTVIIKRGEAGVDKGTLRRLPKEDRKGLTAPGVDETSDVNTEVDKLVKSTDKSYIRSVQQRLVDAGLLDKSNYLPGYADSTTVKAYAVLLEESSRSGRTVDETFSARAQGVQDAGGTGSAAVRRAALSIALTPITDVEQGVKALAPGILGRNVSAAEIQAITSGYNALQSRAQTQDYSMSGPVDGGGVGGSFAQAPSLSDYIKSQLASAHPDESHAMGEANALNTFFDLINGVKSFSNTQGVNVG